MDWAWLQRIGVYYDGHPLVLQVVAEEIRQPLFRDDIARYWQHYEAVFSRAATTRANEVGTEEESLVSAVGAAVGGFCGLGSG